MALTHPDLPQDVGHDDFGDGPLYQFYRHFLAGGSVLIQVGVAYRGELQRQEEAGLGWTYDHDKGVGPAYLCRLCPERRPAGATVGVPRQGLTASPGRPHRGKGQRAGSLRAAS